LFVFTVDQVGDDDDDDDDDDDVDEAIIYVDVIDSNSSSPSSRYDGITNTAPAAPPSTRLPLALPPAVAPSAPAPSRFVPPTSAAAAAAAAVRGPPTPVIITASPAAGSMGPVARPPGSEYEPAASAAATRLSAQYTDALRRRAEALIQKRLRMQARKQT